MIKQITASALTIAALCIGANAVYQGTNPNNLLQTSKAAYQENKRTNERYINNEKSLTKDKVEAEMANNQVNIDDAKKDASDRINDAFEQAYSNVDKDNYKKTSSDLKNKLGKEFGGQIAGLIDPANSIPYSNSIVNKHIGFGKYDIDTHTLPIVITVEYKATESSQINSNDYWTVTYNAKDKTFSNANHQAIIPPQNN